MDMQKVYDQLGGDYEGVLSRLRNDERIKRFLLKFADSHMDESIRNALEAQDYETAFREAHTLKGVCANLSLSTLEHSASALTEALRAKMANDAIAPLFEAVQADYAMTLAALRALSGE